MFPALCITGSTCGDLFLQDALLEAEREALLRLAEHSAGLEMLTFAGLPLAVSGKLYNCTAAVCNGHILGVVPKTYLPNYAEFYEQRHFCPAPDSALEVRLGGDVCLFGTRQLFRDENLPELAVAAELCEDCLLYTSYRRRSE